MKKRLVFLALLPMVGSLRAEKFQPLEATNARPPTPNITSVSRPEDHLFLDNGTVKIGLDRTKGASITWLSWAAHPKNVVNHADPGRLVQQSYYAGRSVDRKADGQSPSWSPWSWNPIQGGGVGSWARITELKRLDDGALFGETIPKLWDMPDEEAAAVMRQWTAFEPAMPDVIVVRCEFVAKRAENDRWGTTKLSPQEIPACYFTRKFSSFRSYLGAGQWRDETQPPGPPWGKAEPPRKAMACFAADGQGVAVFSPAATRPWNFGPHGGGASDDSAAGPCVHIAPIDRVQMGPRSTYRFRYWLIVGTETQIAARLDTLWEKHAGEKTEILTPAMPDANPRSDRPQCGGRESKFLAATSNTTSGFTGRTIDFTFVAESTTLYSDGATAIPVKL